MEELGGIPGSAISLAAVVILIREIGNMYAKWSARAAMKRGEQPDTQMIGEKAVMMERVRRIESICETIVEHERAQTSNIDKVIQAQREVTQAQRELTDIVRTLVRRASTGTPVAGVPSHIARDG